MARLCRIPLKNPLTLIVAGHIWNLGVVGRRIHNPVRRAGAGRVARVRPHRVAHVIRGVRDHRGVDGVDVCFEAAGARIMFRNGIFLAACFWFPWLYLTANIFTSPKTASGLHAAVTAAWYSNSVLFLFIVPMAIATAYYLIPKVIGRPLHSYYLAVAGFWSLAIFGGWTGLQKLIGGPLPTWMTAVSSAAQVFLLIPVVCVAANHFLTARGNHGLIQVSPTLRFVFGGAIFYVGGHLVAAGLALFPGITQFTAAWDGIAVHADLQLFHDDDVRGDLLSAAAPDRLRMVVAEDDAVPLLVHHLRQRLDRSHAPARWRLPGQFDQFVEPQLQRRRGKHQRLPCRRDHRLADASSPPTSSSSCTSSS